MESLRAEQDANAPIAIIARGVAAYWTLTQAIEDQQIAGLVLYQPRAPVLAEPGLGELTAQWARPLLELVPTSPAPFAGYRERALAAQRQGHPSYQQWRLAELRAAPQNQAILIRRLQGWLERLNETGRD